MLISDQSILRESFSNRFSGRLWPDEKEPLFSVSSGEVAVRLKVSRLWRFWARKRSAARAVGFYAIFGSSQTGGVITHPVTS